MALIGRGYLEVHGGNLRQARGKYGNGNQDILDYSANINPLGIPDSVRTALNASIDDIVHYPDPQAHDLKQAIAEHYSVPIEQLVVGNGAAELIYVLLHQLRPQKVLMPAPTFSEYERATNSIAGKIIYFPLEQENGFHINIEEMIKALDDINMCFICNPNNPVGNMLTKDALAALVQAAKDRGVWLVVDESFIDFLPDAAALTCSALVNVFDNLIILHSLTKFFALPGLRLGFGIMPERLARMVELAKDPWNVNNLAQAAGVAALKDLAYIQRSVELIKEEQQFMYSALKHVAGLTAYPPHANFIFLRLDHPVFNSTKLADAMAQRGILIRDCSSYPGLDTHYIRVAVKQREDNLKLLALLESILGLRGTL